MKISNKTIAAFVAAMLTATPILALEEGGDPDPDPCRDGCEEPARGDNGWGNGPDTTNPGSFAGGTASSKSSNGAVRNDRNYPAALDKFEGR